MENQPQQFTAKPKSNFTDSLLFKLGLILILILLLLIPSSWIQSIIWERSQRQDEVIKEISDKWASEQLLEGPVLVLPYKTIVTETDKTGKMLSRELVKNVYILPEALHMDAKVAPEILHRGIFDAVVYNTKIKVNGKFSPLELQKSGIRPELIQWDKARVVIGISDLKGLKNNPLVNFGGKSYAVETDFSALALFKNNLVILPDLSTGKQTALDFNFDLDLRGSDDLSFLPLGKTTTVNVSGDWDNPSFTGRNLPEQRKIGEKTFSAAWKIPYFNRPYAQQWIGDNDALQNKTETAFGVKFILPVDQYQKTTRSAKYGVLIILLTFISLFFTEIIIKKKVHIFQYILIGAAMIIYYVLLLSFSEQLGFNLAYLIASAATVLLLSVFIAALLKQRKPAFLFGAILSVFYGFIFVIIQLQDLALLFGSVGLFIIIAILMYFSTKIDWAKYNTPQA